jgi:lambda family phage portal protein
MARIQSQALADKTELQAQITNAIFGLYAKTDRSSAEIQQSMAPVDDGIEVPLDEGRADFYEKSDLTFNGVRVAVVPEKDSIETLESARASTNFVAFQNYIIRAIASALGISYEQLSNDWSGINYSSARTLLNEIWRGLLADRHSFTQSFCTPIYAAWLEEAVARDMIEIPGGKAMFYVFRDALTQCEWTGPGRGYVDPLKEASAAKLRMELGLSSQTDECEEQGKDARVVRWQRKRDLEEDRAYGLVPDEAAQGNAGGGKDANNGSANPDAADTADRRETAGVDA